MLDFALFVCLLRRGNMAVLNTVLSTERLYPERLSKTTEMVAAAAGTGMVDADAGVAQWRVGAGLGLGALC